MMRWCFRLACVALCAGLPWVHIAFFVPLLLSLPVLCEVLRAKEERVTATLCCAGLGIAVYLLLPETLQALSLWCALMILAVWSLPGGDPFGRGAGWFTIALIGGVMLVGALSLRYPDGAAEGVAQQAADALARAEDGRAMLYRMYRSGLLPLKTGAADLAAINLFGEWGMSGNALEQLTFALRTRLAESLRLNVPRWLAVYSVFTGAVCAWLGDACAARRLGWRDLPKLPDCAMPRAWNMRLVGLWGISLMGYLLGGTVFTMGRMCSGTLETAFWLQGVCVLAWLLQKKRISGMGRVLLVGAAVMLPSILMLAGATDQVFDFRALREARDDADDD